MNTSYKTCQKPVPRRRWRNWTGTTANAYIHENALQDYAWNIGNTLKNETTTHKCEPSTDEVWKPACWTCFVLCSHCFCTFCHTFKYSLYSQYSPGVQYHKPRYLYNAFGCANYVICLWRMGAGATFMNKHKPTLQSPHCTQQLYEPNGQIMFSDSK